MALSSDHLFEDVVVKRIAEELPKVATSERLISSSRDQKSSLFRRPAINFPTNRTTQQRPQSSSGRPQYRNRKDPKTCPKSSSQSSGGKKGK